MAPVHSRLKYTTEALNDALHAIRSKSLSINKAANQFKIPKSTLIDKLNNRYSKSGNTGAPTVLTETEEGYLVSWIIQLGEVGLPVSKAEVKESVAKLVKKLQRKTPFTDGIPGDKWFNCFLNRHPEISKRVPQKLTPARAKVTESDIRHWFARVKAYLEKENLTTVLNDPRRIFNTDESGFYLSPTDDDVYVKRGQRKVYSRVPNDEKECLTVLLTINAHGDLPPPMVVYPYQRVPAAIHASFPKKWAIGNTASGWMTGETFFEYVTNAFYPWLIKNNIELPVIFFVDGHTSHINLHISEFCKEKGIILTAFYPNATHCLQPLDVGVFFPLKRAWKNNVKEYKKHSKRLTREGFARVLEESLKVGVSQQIIHSAFRACGIYPFSENAINYGKLIKPLPQVTPQPSPKVVTPEVPETSRKNGSFLEELEKRLDKHVLSNFRTSSVEWNGDIEYKKFFEFWKGLTTTNYRSNENETSDTRGNIGTNEDENCDIQENGISNENEHDNYDEDNLNNDIMDVSNLLGTNWDSLKAIVDSSNSTLQLLTSTPNSSIQETSEIFQSEDLSPTTPAETQTSSMSTETNVFEKISTSSAAKTTLLLTEVNVLRKNSTSPTLETASKQSTLATQEPPSKQSTLATQETPSKQSTSITQETPSKQPTSATPTQETPSKQANSLSENYPTPFKDCLFWPEESEVKKKKKNNVRKYPTVVIEEDFMNYQKKVIQEKRRKEEERKKKQQTKEEERMKKRSKAIQKAKELAQKKKRKKDTYESEDSDDVDDVEPVEDHPSCSNSSGDTEVPSCSTSSKPLVNTYVIIKYEDDFYPGLVLETSDQGAKVKVMQMAGPEMWKWPEQEDILFYENNDIMETINIPEIKNQRGYYSVPEILKYHTWRV